MKPDWHDRPTEPGLWVVKRAELYFVMSVADATKYGTPYRDGRYYGPL